MTFSSLLCQIDLRVNINQLISLSANFSFVCDGPIANWPMPDFTYELAQQAQLLNL